MPSEWPFVHTHPGTLPFITPFSHGYPHLGRSASGLGSLAWGSANRAMFMPIVLGEPCVITKFGVFNGTTVNGNIDMGIYKPDRLAQTATRIVSAGSTAQAGTSVMQEFDITDTYLDEGLYFLGLASDSATNHFIGTATNNNVNPLLQMHLYLAASSFALPATVTLATATGAYERSWWCGMLTSPRTVI
jgi:hypothetical protein